MKNLRSILEPRPSSIRGSIEENGARALSKDLSIDDLFIIKDPRALNLLAVTADEAVVSSAKGVDLRYGSSTSHEDHTTISSTTELPTVGLNGNQLQHHSNKKSFHLRRLSSIEEEETLTNLCSPGNNFCHTNSICFVGEHFQRGYDCNCKIGYAGDGIFVCKHFDECANNYTCELPERGGFCEDRAPDAFILPSKYACGCRKGFEPTSGEPFAEEGRGPLKCSPENPRRDTVPDSALIQPSFQPSVSIQPSVSVQPSQPSVSLQPSASIQPSDSFQPSISIHPSIQPSVSLQPSVSIQPVKSSTRAPGPQKWVRLILHLHADDQSTRPTEVGEAYITCTCRPCLHAQETYSDNQESILDRKCLASSVRLAKDQRLDPKTLVLFGLFHYQYHIALFHIENWWWCHKLSNFECHFCWDL